MIIPVRCFSCGKPVGHLWEEYKKRVVAGEKPKKFSMNLALKDTALQSNVPRTRRLHRVSKQVQEKLILYSVYKNSTKKKF